MYINEQIYENLTVKNLILIPDNYIVDNQLQQNGTYSEKKRANKRRINALNSASLKRRTDRCVNPFKVIGHVRKNLLRVTGAVLEKFSDLHEKDKICNSCRKLGFECNPKPKKKKKRNSKVANTA